MINESYLNREQILRKVTLIGNGAHVFAPKEWAEEEVLLIRTKKPSLKEKILKILEPYLENVLGAYLYGSYARGEETIDSDIDLLIISNKDLNIKAGGFEIVTLKKDKVKGAIKIAPVLIYSALAEAKPVINSELLGELRKSYKPSVQDFRSYIKETKNMIRVNEEILDPYSIILRLRGIYAIERFFSGGTYSHKGFKKEILNKGGKYFLQTYDDYQKIKKGLKVKTNENDLRELLNILKDRTKKLEEILYGKKKKKT